MPKKTFDNLPEEKRQEIIDAFLKEFTLYKYDDASITRVVKQIGIAKGSIYQYFEDKLDLFTFLQLQCAQTKAMIIEHIDREDYADFWAYWTDLYRQGLKFDRKYPLMSNFLYSVHHHKDAPGYEHIYKANYKQVFSALTSMIQAEVDRGDFRDDISVESMTFMLFSMSTQLPDYMEVVYDLDHMKRKLDGKPLFAGKSTEVLDKTIIDYIKLLKPAFQAQNKH